MNETDGNKSVKRTLMFENQELLDFEADPATKEVRVLDAPEAHDALLASLGFGGPDLEAVVAGVIERRRMADNRDDIAQILDGFDAHTAFELTLKGHGLSLSDHLWYRAPGSTERWEDVNFFDNEWDTTFCESVMTREYARLASCSPDVPDITTRGFLKKTWERTDDGIYLLKEANHENGADLVGSLLAEKLCCRLYGQDAYHPLSIERRYGRDVAASPLMASRDEELVQGPRLFAMAGFDVQEMAGIRGPIAPQNYVDIMSRAGMPDAMAQVAKMFAFMSLALLGVLRESIAHIPTRKEPHGLQRHQPRASREGEGMQDTRGAAGARQEGGLQALRGGAFGHRGRRGMERYSDSLNAPSTRTSRSFWWTAKAMWLPASSRRLP